MANHPTLLATIDSAARIVTCALLLTLTACDRGVPRYARKPLPPPPTGWRSFGDTRMGFSIDYPKGWHVDRGYAYRDTIQGGRPAGVSFTVPHRITNRTNLASDTHLSVEAQTAAAPCSVSLFLAAPQDEHSETSGGYRWSVAKGGDAGAGNFYDETVYVLGNSQPCLAVRYFIHSTNIGNYDPGAVRQFDRRALVAMFDRMRATLMLSGDREKAVTNAP